MFDWKQGQKTYVPTLFPQYDRFEYDFCLEKYTVNITVVYCLTSFLTYNWKWANRYVDDAFNLAVHFIVQEQDGPNTYAPFQHHYFWPSSGQTLVAQYPPISLLLDPQLLV